MIKVTTLYSLVEDAYEKGVDRANLQAAYAAFKTVVPTRGLSGSWTGSSSKPRATQFTA